MKSNIFMHSSRNQMELFRISNEQYCVETYRCQTFFLVSLCFTPSVKKPAQKGVKMKTILCVVITLGVLLFLSSCAQTKTPLPIDNLEELVGIWINPGHSTYPQKIVVQPDGIYLKYKKIEDTTYVYTDTLKVIEKWVDSKVSPIIARSAVILQRRGSRRNVRIFSEIVGTLDCAKHFIVCELVGYPFGLFVLLVVFEGEA